MLKRMPLDFRLEIPPLIAAACAGLVILFVIFLMRMLSESRSVRRDIRLLQALIGQFPPLTPETRHAGLQLNTVESVRSSSAGQSRTVRRLWNEVELSLEPYRGSDEATGWFSVRPTTELFSENVVVDSGYHSSFHQTVPSILTALGLMTTFVAILLALEGVNVQLRGGAEIVEGIGGLINGLAGKFLSSIVALLLAVTFTLFEKATERRLRSAYDDLLRTAAESIPVLSAFRVQLDVHALSARRTEMLERFYTEMAERVVSAARTQILPAVSGILSNELVDSVEARLAGALDEIRDRAAELDRIASSLQATVADDV
ncbi:MAG TPA: hypothetical protein VEX68_07430 [Bryobacteraceae bacterium]|nr:hypothetical protein [Bryobacteraceae bacterium]